MPQKAPLITAFNDDEVFVELVGELLANEGYVVHTGLVDGQAYDYVKRHQPDLVILDFLVNNPQSAWVILELLRLDPATAQLPILICSANIPLLRDNAEHLHALNSATLSKPFLLDDLLQQVAALVQKI